MFLSLLGATLAFGAAVLAASVYSEGALVALRTAAQFIGWFLAVAALSGLAGLRRAHFGQLGAAGVALCSAAGLLYMSYFLDWHELPQSAIRHAAAAEPLPVRLVEPAPVTPTPVAPQKFAAVPPVDIPVIRTVKAKTTVSDSCSAFTGVESLQCKRCSGKSNLAWLACQEQVRLDFCASGAGDEGTCPSPIPPSYPG